MYETIGNLRCNNLLYYLHYKLCDYVIRFMVVVSSWVTKTIYKPIYDYVKRENMFTRARVFNRKMGFRYKENGKDKDFFVESRFWRYEKYVEEKRLKEEEATSVTHNINLIAEYSEKTGIPQSVFVDAINIRGTRTRIANFSTVKEVFYSTLPSWKNLKKNTICLFEYLPTYYAWNIVKKIIYNKVKNFRIKNCNETYFNSCNVADDVAYKWAFIHDYKWNEKRKIRRCARTDIERRNRISKSSFLTFSVRLFL